MRHFRRTNGPFITVAASFGWWSCVYSGQLFDGLTKRQKQAVICHEMFHCEQHHTEWRVLALFLPFLIPWLCWKQEFEADAYAARNGFAQDLIEVLAQHDRPSGLTHPGSNERIERLAVFALPPSRATLASVA